MRLPTRRQQENNSMRDKALTIWNAGLQAVLGEPLVTDAIEIDGDFLMIDGESVDRKDFDRVLVVGGGKAGSSMARGLEHRLADWLPVSGIVNVPEGTERKTNKTPTTGVRTHPARPPGVNEPTAAGVEGAQQMMEIVRSASARDLVIVLISGGGSALIPLPTDGVSLEDKVAVTRYLSGVGATIDQLNTVRKHLSKIKGGGLLRACNAGRMLTLILSDVLGDPVDLIASGPTVEDPSRTMDALAVLNRFDPDGQLPSSVYRILSQTAGEQQHTLSTTQARTIVIGNNAVAVDAAGIQAESMGLNHLMQSAVQSEGAAEVIGVRIANLMVERLRTPTEERKHDCLIWGGEPTVELVNVDQRGKGGRNQQLVLAAYQHLIELNLSESEWERIVILSAGTDGEDGPTDAAGAVIDVRAHRRAIALQLDPQVFLDRNDAYSFFSAVDGLILTGPTGTNVCDLRVAIVR